PRSARRLASFGERDERTRLGLDRLAVEQASEPHARQPVDAVPRAEQGAGDRGVRVRVAAETDDATQLGLGVAAAEQRLERDRGGEQAEPLVGPVDLPLRARRVDEELELLA